MTDKRPPSRALAPATSERDAGQPRGVTDPATPHPSGMHPGESADHMHWEKK